MCDVIMSQGPYFGSSPNGGGVLKLGQYHKKLTFQLNYIVQLRDNLDFNLIKLILQCTV